MSEGRAPRSRYYDGVVYGWFVEPALSGLHERIAARLPPGERVLDACCGTGALARKLAAAGWSVTGVDLSPRSIAYARRRAAALGDRAPRFEVGDVATLARPQAGPWDVAVMVLALHEMPAAARIDVVRNLLRVARTLVLVDFTAPMPFGRAGLRNRLAELLAGPEHFSGYRDFQRRGGLRRLLEEVGAPQVREETFDRGTLHLVQVDASGTGR
jgi:SAM-dependent methyltransferase